METNNWVDEHLAPLHAKIDWQPDIPHGLALLRQRKHSDRERARRRLRVSGALMVGALGLLAFPVTRVLANKCVGACVAGAGQVGALFRSQFFPPDDPATPLTTLPGKMAPDFSLADSSGGTVRVSEFRGKLVVLNFWATWCQPCIEETPWFVELQRKYRDAGLVVMGVSMDDDGWKSVKPFMAQMNINYPVVLGDQRIANLYGGMEALPATVIIDRSGHIAAVHVGLIGREDFENNLKAMLGSHQE